jgi:hypothetical protein
MMEKFGGFKLWRKIRQLRINSEGTDKIAEEKKKFELQRIAQKDLEKASKMTYYLACK